MAKEDKPKGHGVIVFGSLNKEYWLNEIKQDGYTITEQTDEFVSFNK